MKKLKILDKEYEVLNVKVIKTETSMITIEEKSKGLVILISDNIIKDLNIIDFKGFQIIREKELRYIKLIGLDIKLRIDIVTKLNISKKILFIEEFKKDVYRLTFSKNLIEDIINIETLDLI